MSVHPRTALLLDAICKMTAMASLDAIFIYGVHMTLEKRYKDKKVTTLVRQSTKRGSHKALFFFYLQVGKTYLFVTLAVITLRCSITNT